jgi:hypothetical protein
MAAMRSGVVLDRHPEGGGVQAYVLPSQESQRIPWGIPAKPNQWFQLGAQPYEHQYEQLHAVSHHVHPVYPQLVLNSHLECLDQSSEEVSCECTPDDMWSLGVILVDLASDRNVWKQTSVEDSTYQAFTKEPEFLQTILPLSDELNDILGMIFGAEPHEESLNLLSIRRNLFKVMEPGQMYAREMEHPFPPVEIDLNSSRTLPSLSASATASWDLNLSSLDGCCSNYKRFIRYVSNSQSFVCLFVELCTILTSNYNQLIIE